MDERDRADARQGAREDEGRDACDVHGLRQGEEGQEGAREGAARPGGGTLPAGGHDAALGPSGDTGDPAGRPSPDDPFAPRAPRAGLDPMELRGDLDAVMQSKGLLFAKGLDEGMRDDLRASWRQLARARGGTLSSADIQDTLRTYLRLGMLRRPPSTERSGDPQPYSGMPKSVAARLATGVPTRPAAGPGSPYPTIARIARARSAGAETRPLPAAAYGSFSHEFGAYAFEWQGDGTLEVLPVVRCDRRFERLLAMLAANHVALVVIGESGPAGLDIWDLRAVGDLPEDDPLHTMSPDLLDLMLERLRALPEPSAQPQQRPRAHDDTPAGRPRARLASVDDVAAYLSCMEDTLPPSIRAWAHQNLDVTRDEKASKEERGHAARALSLVLSVQWQRTPFRRVDPARARAVLDAQLFGLDGVKQRIVETIVQINRTHTLPLYGLLLAGPAGVGKSQIAYATARILGLPWASLDMSAIRDLAALVGSDRVYANAKPGRVMEALAQAGSATMVLVLNELDKADEGGQNGSSADALLTLFDNLGFTDNYVECSVPTDGIYPVATANDLDKISAPLLTRFEVIEIPDYSPEEKRVILRDYSLPKVLGHMGLADDEFELSDAALDCVIERYRDESGCRSLEKAAEHLAAHALFLLESDPSRDKVRFDAADVRLVLDS